MSIFGSLYTAVSGLQAQSSSISMISNNIANTSTVGYKRTDSDFSSLVTSAGRSTTYSPGSVRSIQRASVTEQGTLSQTSSNTDIAISGNGFYVVEAATTGTSEPLYTRAGSFSEDSGGNLVNAQGFYLMGWALDQNGKLPSSQADISSLSAVNVSFLGGLTLPTTTASLSMNLQADQTATAYPIASGFTADFSRSIKTYDSLGQGHNLSVYFKKMTSPTADVSGSVKLSGITGNLSSSLTGLNATDQFSITVGGVTQTITTSGTASDIISTINAMVDASGNTLAYAKLNDAGDLEISASNPGDTLTLANVTGTPLAALGLTAATTAAPTSPTLLTSLDSTQNINTEGWWQVEYRTDDGTVIDSGAINFTGDGKLNAVKDLSGAVNVDLTNIDWGNGSSLQDINFDMAGFTQYSGQYNVISSNQNGAELGLRTGVSIDKDGYVIAQFSNGQSKQIYKLALATFANANGLTELTGNVYRESDTSGSYNLREAGQGGSGTISSGALEESNVDLADEFSKMIVTQRAYSANTKVISAADDMLQELLNIK